MIVHWTRVGFVHGVMNTDNMSVLGLMIDYGPYGWLSFTTHRGLPTQRMLANAVLLWESGTGEYVELARFAESIRALIPDGKILEAAIMKEYGERFSERHEMA